ncbi:MAG: peroxiredoxin [Candidatus Thorarchaeota archaeon]
MLKSGDPAPDFETVDESGRPFRLSDNRGKKVVLYFYPRDFTPGCTAEACSIRDSYSMFQQSGIAVYGISGGSPESHKNFKEKHRLPFPILVDTDLRIAGLYGARSWTRILGIGVKRVTFLIDEEGRIEAVFGDKNGVEAVKSAQHAQQILGYWKLKI